MERSGLRLHILVAICSQYIIPPSLCSGLYLQDLTFIEMQPSYLEDKSSINFTKRWKQFKSVDHIRFAQTK